MNLAIIIKACKVASSSRVTAEICVFHIHRMKKDKSPAPSSTEFVVKFHSIAMVDHGIIMD